MDPADEFFFRLVTEEDIAHARDLMSPAERAVIIAVRAGAEIQAVDVAQMFGLEERTAARLVERIKARYAVRTRQRKT